MCLTVTIRGSTGNTKDRNRYNYDGACFYGAMTQLLRYWTVMNLLISQGFSKRGKRSVQISLYVMVQWQCEAVTMMVFERCDAAVKMIKWRVF